MDGVSHLARKLLFKLGHNRNNFFSQSFDSVDGAADGGGRSSRSGVLCVTGHCKFYSFFCHHAEVRLQRGIPFYALFLDTVDPFEVIHPPPTHRARGIVVIILLFQKGVV